MPELPATHKPGRVKCQKHGYNERKKDNQAKRFYRTNDKRWRAIRAAQLAANPICRECANNDTVTAATEVDHIDTDTSNNHDSNLQSLCKPCHSSKTARENNFGRN